MQTYFVRDTQPNSPGLMIEGAPPNINFFAPTYQEVRVGELPDRIWLDILLRNVDPDPVFWFDNLLQQYFDAAEVWWTREGGYTVNVSE